jgi:hypothetical protein
MPPHLACKFTTSEQAVLRIVGDECRDHGCCALHIDAIAARAGTCRTTAQNALRMARGGSEAGWVLALMQYRQHHTILKARIGCADAWDSTARQ